MLMGNKRFRNHAMQAQQDKEDGIVRYYNTFKKSFHLTIL